MEILKKLICTLFGHAYRKTAYIEPCKEVYVCERCGKRIVLHKGY